MSFATSSAAAMAASAALAVLAGCAATPSPITRADAAAPAAGHCAKNSRGEAVACVATPAPSLQADAEAKRFLPDPEALTVLVVRRNWADARHVVPVRVNGATVVETLPDSFVRLRLAPGAHTLALEFEGQRQVLQLDGRAGELRWVRIEGTVSGWQPRFGWLDEPAATTRERALQARLVADLALR